MTTVQAAIEYLRRQTKTWDMKDHAMFIEMAGRVCCGSMCGVADRQDQKNGGKTEGGSMRKRKRRKLRKDIDTQTGELGFSELTEQREIKRRRAEIHDAIRLSVRAGIKPPLLLVRYRTCLGRLQEWVFKKKLAETKYDRYEREAKRIAKRLNKEAV